MRVKTIGTEIVSVVSRGPDSSCSPVSDSKDQRTRPPNTAGNGILALGQSALNASFQVLQETICRFKGWSYLGVPLGLRRESFDEASGSDASQSKRVFRFVGASSAQPESALCILHLHPVIDEEDADDNDADNDDDDDDDDDVEDGDSDSSSEDSTDTDCPSLRSAPNLMHLLLTYDVPLGSLGGGPRDGSGGAATSGSPVSPTCASVVPLSSSMQLPLPRPCSSPSFDHNHSFGCPSSLVNPMRTPPLLLLELPSSSTSGIVREHMGSPAHGVPCTSDIARAHRGSRRMPVASSPPRLLLPPCVPCPSPGPAGGTPSPCAHDSLSSGAASPQGVSSKGHPSFPASPQPSFPAAPQSESRTHSPVAAEVAVSCLPEIIKCGLCCEQGERASNEDMAFALEILEPPPTTSPVGAEDLPSSSSEARAFSKAACFGVFDGHGGVEAAQHMTNNLPGLMVSRCTQIRAEGAEEVTSIMLMLEAQLQARFLKEWDGTDSDPGTTALLAIIMDDTLLVANVGDCRLILVQQAVDAQGNNITYVAKATKDHSCAKNEDERQRVHAAGAVVDPSGYVGMLEVTRSLGDFKTKGELGAGVIIANPEVTTLQLTPDTLFIVAFSDGISSVMNDLAVCNRVAAYLNNKKHLNDPVYAATELCNYAIGSAGSSDNCSAVVVVLKNVPPVLPARRPLFSQK